jgi:sec-independent protein translocase protein TatA
MRLFSPTSIVMIVVFGALLFGSKRLPDAFRSLGQSVRILKSEAKALRDDEPSGQQTSDTTRVVKAAPGESRRS